MTTLTNVQENLIRLVENFKLYTRELTKYKQLNDKYILVGHHKKDFESRMEALKSEMNIEDYTAKINFVENSIFKICKLIDKNKMYTNLFCNEVNIEFIHTLGLDFTITPNARDTGNFYTFYIDNKMAFSKFESHPGCIPDIYLGGLN